MLLFIRAPFHVLLVFIICVVCLLVVLVKLSLLAKLLARKTTLSSESSPLQFLALVKLFSELSNNLVVDLNP